MKKALIILTLIFSLFSCNETNEYLDNAITQYENTNQLSDLIHLVKMALKFQDGVIAKEYSEKLYKIEEDNIEYKCLYAASLGVYAGSSRDRNQQIEYGQKSLDLLNECVETKPDYYLPYLYRGISGVRSPKFLKRYKKSINDFKQITNMLDNGLVIEDNVISMVYSYYRRALLLDGKSSEAKKIMEEFEDKYPYLELVKGI